MALSLDGSAHAPGTTAVSTTVTLTTTNSNDIIYLCIVSNAAVSSVSGGGLTWILRDSGSATTNFVTSYYAVAPSPLTSAVITINMVFSTFVTADIFGISGANTSSVFDAGGPVAGVGGSTITTTSGTCFIVGSGLSTQSAAASGWTVISAAPTDFIQTDYQVSGNGTYTINDSTNSMTISLIDAIKQAGIGDILMSQIWL